MKTKLLSFLTLALFATSTLFAQDTSITYQGRLNDNGAPVNGLYDVRFSLFDSGNDGLQLGESVIQTATITNGLFTAEINFGTNFVGANRWLQLEVRTNGNGAYTVLDPRQRVTAAPYSTYSLYAATAETAGSASNVVSGTVVSSVNALKDDVILQAGSNVTITPSGNILTLAAAGVGGSGIWNLNGSKTYYNAGNVGVGTEDPANKMTLFTSPNSYGFEHTDGNVRLATFLGGSVGGGWLGTMSNHRLNFFVNDGSASMTVQTSGNVGIGTISPLAKLHLWDAGSLSHRIETGGGINSWAKLEFVNANGQWHAGTSRGFNGDVFYMDRIGNSSLEFQLAPNGNLGLGIEPQAKLHLYDPASSISHRIQTGGGVNSWSRTEYANANGEWQVGTSRSFNGDQLYFYRAGAANVAFGIQPNGDASLQGMLTCKVLTITGGADVAEPFSIKEKNIEKGSVVVIDDEHPGRLKASSQPYDRRVAGIVSGANGVNAGIALQQEGILEGGQNVALSGRVYVLADAAHGAIRPGDLLTTSGTPGHAMKVTHHAKAQGAILGKAMSALNEGKGMVLVLVTLQ